MLGKSDLSTLTKEQLLQLLEAVTTELTNKNTNTPPPGNTADQATVIFEGLRDQLIKHFSAEYISNNFINEDKDTALYQAADLFLNQYSIQLDPLIITLHLDGSEKLTTLEINGLDQTNCQALLDDYLIAPQRKTRSTDEESLDRFDGKAHEVTLTLSSRHAWTVNICFINNSLQFEFLNVTQAQGNAKQYFPNKGQEFIATLFQFIDDRYSIPKPSYMPDLQINGNAIHLTEDEEAHGLAVSLASQANLADTQETEKTDLPEVQNTYLSKTPSQSTASADQIALVTEGDNYIKVTVNGHTGNLQLSACTTRPSTFLGKKQGAHITAYIVFVTAVLEAVDEHSIHEIPNLLLTIAEQLLPVTEPYEIDENDISNEDADALERTNQISALDKLKGEVADHIKKFPLFFDKKQRKKHTAELRSKEFNEQVVQESKLAIKVRNSTLLAGIIDSIANTILIETNKNPEAIFLRVGKKSPSELGKEGARVREAMKKLRSLNLLIKWIGDNKTGNVKPLPELLKRGPAHEGLKHFISHSPLTEEKIITFAEALYQGETSKTAALGSNASLFATANSSSINHNPTTGKISQLILDLFDLDYYEYTVSRLLSALISKAKQECREKQQLMNSAQDKKKAKEELNNTLKVIDELSCHDSKEMLKQMELLDSGEEAPINKSELHNNIDKLVSYFSSQLENTTHVSSISAINNMKDMISEAKKYSFPALQQRTEKHSNFIMQAFPGIGALPDNVKIQIKQEFMKKVWQTMRWNESGKAESSFLGTQCSSSFNTQQKRK